MKPKDLERLLELIGELVREGGGTWKEKRDQVLAEASDDDKTNLEEFSNWFVEGRPY